eukprot:758760-Hanusia_phi.AAC.8
MVSRSKFVELALLPLHDCLRLTVEEMPRQPLLAGNLLIGPDLRQVNERVQKHGERKPWRWMGTLCQACAGVFGQTAAGDFTVLSSCGATLSSWQEEKLRKSRRRSEVKEMKRGKERKSLCMPEYFLSKLAMSSIFHASKRYTPVRWGSFKHADDRRERRREEGWRT